MNVCYPPSALMGSTAFEPEPDISVNTVIVGGGPAGVAPLIAASRANALADVLAGGLAIVERGSAIGIGRIGTYAINSDSTADTLVNCVLENPHALIGGLRDHAATKAVMAYGRGSVPLHLVGSLMGVVGGVLQQIMTVGNENKVVLHHEAVHTQRTRDGLWETRIRCLAAGTIRTIRSRVVILATGGHQPCEQLESQYVGGGYPCCRATRAS